MIGSTPPPPPPPQPKVAPPPPPPPQPAPLPPARPMMTQAVLEAKVAEWKRLKAWLDEAKAKELALRKEIAEAMFGTMKEANGAFPEGTRKNTVPGSSSVLVGSLNTKWNREIIVEVMTTTLEEAKLTPDEAKGLIRGKPELGLKAYKALPPEKRVIIDKMIVVKQGAINLDIETFPK